MLKLPDVHVRRIYDYRVTEDDLWRRDHKEWESLSDIDKHKVCQDLQPSHEELAHFSSDLLELSNLEEICTFHDYATMELFAGETEKQIVTCSSVKYAWNYSDTYEDFVCRCGKCYRRRASGRRDLCYPAGFALAAIPRHHPSAVFENLWKLDLFFPSSVIEPPGIVWADLADFVLLCPLLQVLWVQISSSDHHPHEAPISIFVRMLARGLRLKPLESLRHLFLKYNPCRSSREAPVVELMELIQHVSETIESIGLIFDQLHMSQDAYDTLTESIHRLNPIPAYRLAFNYGFVAVGKETQRGRYQDYRHEYAVKTPSGKWNDRLDSMTEADDLGLLDSAATNVYFYEDEAEPIDERIGALGDNYGPEPCWDKIQTFMASCFHY